MVQASRAERAIDILPALKREDFSSSLPKERMKE
jgi:hypothetical protein